MFGTGSDNTSKTYKLYTGLENFVVEAVNPTLEEIKALGYNRDQEPEYIDTETYEDKDSGETKTARRIRIDFYLNNKPDEGEPEIKGILSFFISDYPVKFESSGRTEFINAYGQTASLPSLSDIPENMQWFNLEKARPSMQNERFFINFLRNILNLTKDDYSIIEDKEALFNNDLSAFKQELEKFPTNKVGVLCGVKSIEQEDGSVKRYQTFYVRDFLRPYTVPGNRQWNFFKTGVENYKANNGAPTTDYGNLETMELVEYDPTSVTATNNQGVNSQDTISTGGSW